MSQFKLCKKCGTTKNINYFGKDKSRKDGHYLFCMQCQRKRLQLWRDNNRQKQRKRLNKYAKQNPQKSIQYRRKESSIKRKAEYDKVYRSQNAQKFAKSKKQYDKRNKNNPQYKIKKNLRRRLHHALNDNLKLDKTMNLVGCSGQFLKKYLENQFTEEMNWNNYGSYWHIDHIVMICEFDLSKQQQQRKCFHYTNLRPLSAEDNLKKKKNIPRKDTNL